MLTLEKTFVLESRTIAFLTPLLLHLANNARVRGT